MALSFALSQCSGVELNKSLMFATVTVFVTGAPQVFRVKYNDAVPFAKATTAALTASV